MKNFIKTAVSSFKTSGTIHPSSPSLVRKLLNNIDFNEDIVIIELGTGDGVVTKEIARKINPNSTLLALEINPTFCDMARKAVCQYHNVEVLNESALDILHVLEKRGISNADHIISSLPLSFFKQSETRQLLEDCYTAISPGGYYKQYQYSLDKYKMLKKIFDHVKLDYTLRNVPPAFIYSCTKKS